MNIRQLKSDTNQPTARFPYPVWRPTMKRTPSLSLISSSALVLCYVTFAILAFTRFQAPYSPTANWLSDLGNPDASPNGAVFYNTGIIISSLLLLAFFVSLARIRQKNNRVQNFMTVLTMGFGAAGSLGMLMSALYPINQPAQHSFWCMVMFFSIGTAFAFSIAALRYQLGFPRWLLVFGIIVVLLNLVTQVFFNDVQITEWFNVAFLLGYCLLLGIATRRL